MKTTRLSTWVFASLVSGGLVLSFGYMLSFAYAGESMDRMSMALSAVPRFYWVSFVPLVVFLAKNALGKFKVSVALIACFFALSTLISASFSMAGSLTVLACDGLSSLLSLFTFICLALFWYWAIYAIYMLLGELKTRSGGGGIVPLLLVACAWLPYIACCWPSRPSVDLCNQLEQFSGEVAFSTHHPVASTLIYGTVNAIGEFTGVGYGAIVVFQTALLLGAVYLVFRVMTRLQAPRYAIWLAAIFYAVIPVFGVYTQFLVKDVLFGAIFAAYLGLVFLLVRVPHSFCRSPKCMVMLFVVACLCGIVRNNGMYVVVLTLPLLIVANREQWSKPTICVLLSLSIACPALVSTAINGAVRAEPGNIREALSLPFQQVARVFHYSPGDVSDQEYRAVDAVLDADTLGDRYVEYGSDPVKGVADTEKAKLIDFLWAWWSIGLKYPIVYADAAVAQTYAYWSIIPADSYHTDFKMSWMFWLSDPEDDLGLFGARGRDVVADVMDWARKAPVVELFCQPGTYTWLLMMEIGYLLFKKHRRETLAYLPCIVLLLTCIASPVNGLVRYAFGLMLVAPLAAWFPLSICGASEDSSGDVDLRTQPYFREGEVSFADADESLPSGRTDLEVGMYSRQEEVGGRPD